MGHPQLGPALHIPAVIKPHITDVGPPLGSARDREADRAVHEFRMAKASPSIARGLKWRLSSALWPIDSYKMLSSILDHSHWWQDTQVSDETQRALKSWNMFLA